jgi:hypothetical protein
MGSTPSPPPAPDPAATAAAQSQMNKETAVTQYGLGATNQVTPYGNLTYDQIGKWEDGTPRFQATTALSPEQQDLYNLNTQTQKGIGQIGVDQTKRIADLLSSPVNLNNEATEGRLMELGRNRLDPLMQQRRSALETKLYNQGAMPGTEAWSRAMTEAGQQENDAYNQLLLTGRQQATQEALTERNQPINEITALLRGSGVQQPSFTNTPTPNVAPTDYLGAVNMQQSALNNQYNQQVGSQNAMWGALGSIGGTALGGWGSGGFKMPKWG